MAAAVAIVTAVIAADQVARPVVKGAAGSLAAVAPQDRVQRRRSAVRLLNAPHRPSAVRLLNVPRRSSEWRHRKPRRKVRAAAVVAPKRARAMLARLPWRANSRRPGSGRRKRRGKLLRSIVNNAHKRDPTSAVPMLAAKTWRGPTLVVRILLAPKPAGQTLLDRTSRALMRGVAAQVLNNAKRRGQISIGRISIGPILSAPTATACRGVLMA